VTTFVVLSACSQSGDTLTVVPDTARMGEATIPTTSGTVDAGSIVVEPSGTGAAQSTLVPEITTSTIPEEGATTTTDTASAADDPVNIYALAGARVIAARANENDLSGLDPDAVSEVLLEASEAAYEIEYPSVVMYLDVSQDDDMNIVVVTEDESQTIVGTAYVCVVDGTAVAQEDACNPASSN
jgi:hypothetical protein